MSPECKAASIDIESLFDISADPESLRTFSDPDDIPLVLPGVYMIYGPSDALLYVGQSGNIRGRIRTHAREKSWFPKKACKIRTVTLGTVDERLLLETLLILRHGPRHNRTIKLGLDADGGLTELQFLRTRRKR